jgi:hypothetical protein
MGCLPIPALFLIGALIGHFVGGNSGMLWGSGIGLLVGLVLAGLFIWVIRRGK